jgi:hypothetical protein
MVLQITQFDAGSPSTVVPRAWRVAARCVAPIVCTLLLARFPSVASGDEGAGTVAEVTLGPPVVVAVSPPEYGRGDPDGRWWGFFQFPDLWQGNDGSLAVAVHVGADSVAGRHEPTLFFASRDRGRTWRQAAVDDLDLTPEIISLSDGRQAAFGKSRRPQYLAATQAGDEQRSIDVAALAIKPVAGPYRDGYKVNEYLVYRFDDIPADRRRFAVSFRDSATAQWRKSEGSIEFPGLQVTALVRAMWWDDAGKEEWVQRPPRVEIPVPKGVVPLPDGTMLWPLASQHPTARKFHARVACLASEDAGRTWRVRGMIADGLDTSWGYGFGEQSLARMPDGDLLCVMRTLGSEELGESHHLAAARSADGGRTWKRLPPPAEFSVMPNLVALANGMVALVYGRPGVHVKASADCGRTWSESQPIVGPAEREILAEPATKWWECRHDWSCANPSLVVTGPDRFLVAFSDFRHLDAEGRPCKAIEVREVVVAARPGR